MDQNIPDLGKCPVFVTLPASTGKVLLASIQKAAEAVANAVLPGQELTNQHSRELKDDSYEPVLAPSSGTSSNPTAKLPPTVSRKIRGIVYIYFHT